MKAVFEQLIEQESCSPRAAHELTTHFRSTQAILNLAGAIRSGKRKAITSVQKQQGELPVLLQIKDQTPVDQATIALRRLQRYEDKELGSVAFIVPSDNGQCDSVAAFLQEQHISCSILAKESLYQLRHVKRLLVYLQLIKRPENDEDMKFLLRSCLVPYFEEPHIQRLKHTAQQAGCSLQQCLQTETLRATLRLPEKQLQALQAHLAILTQFGPTSQVKQVFDEIAAIERGPITELKGEGYEMEDVNAVRGKLQAMSVGKALDEIKRRISFTEPQRKHEGWYVSTIDYARSEEFDTVVLLNAAHLPSTNRLYVGVARARKRVFLCVNEHGKQSSFLYDLQKDLYTLEQPE